MTYIYKTVFEKSSIKYNKIENLLKIIKINRKYMLF